MAQRRHDHRFEVAGSRRGITRLIKPAVRGSRPVGSPFVTFDHAARRSHAAALMPARASAALFAA
jgi:hypothetical protein